MKYNFDTLVNRKGTYAVKLDAMPEGSHPDAVSVWVADMDFPVAQPIIDALHARIDRQIFGYTLYENEELKATVTGWFAKRFDWKVAAEDVFFSPGVVPAIAFLIQALTEPGDGVIIQRPVYYPFAAKIEGNGRVVYNSPLVNDGGVYTMDYDDLEVKFADEKVKGMVFCSPHNPVGRVWKEEELRRLVAIAKKYDKWIISDEIHMDLTRKGISHHPLTKVAPEYADRIILCTAPSKTFNLAGMQLSNVIITNDDYKAKWAQVIDVEVSCGMANPFGIEATIAAYTEGESWLDQLRDYLDGNIAYIASFLKENLPKAVMSAPEGTYLVWIDLNAYISDPVALERLMQNTAKVAFDEGYIFGEEGNGFERINVATQRSVIEEVMKRMKLAIDTL